ncbi:hypothetical protein Taro_046949, partial [Colocasia esculenta]|nr:hypothetical protein [Colocasia esculenta]
MGSRQARRLLCHLRGPAWGSASASARAKPTNHHHHHHAHRQQHSGPYFGTRPNLAEFKDSPARFSRGFVSWYLGMLDARPVLTKSVTAGVIFIAADLSAQTITLGPSDSYDLIRTSRMAGYGMLISGPSLHFWFNFLSKILPKRDVINTLKKMFLGQTIYGPIISTVFFSLNAFLQ